MPLVIQEFVDQREKFEGVFCEMSIKCFGKLGEKLFSIQRRSSLTEPSPKSSPQKVPTLPSVASSESARRCQECGWETKTAVASLRQAQLTHIARLHLSRPVYSCRFCDYTRRRWYLEKKAMTEHLRRHGKAGLGSQGFLIDHEKLRPEAADWELKCFARAARTTEQSDKTTEQARMEEEEEEESDASLTEAVEESGKQAEEVPAAKGASDGACLECGEAGLINTHTTRRFTHLLKEHLKRPRVVCKSCSYSDYSWHLGGIRSHLTSRHQRKFKSIQVGGDLTSSWTVSD